MSTIFTGPPHLLPVMAQEQDPFCIDCIDNYEIWVTFYLRTDILPEKEKLTNDRTTYLQLSNKHCELNH